MFDCILLMAGSGKRTHLSYNKIKYEINGKAIYQYSLEKFLACKDINKVIMVVSEEDYNDFKKLESDKIVVVKGGKERQDSVKCGLMKATTDVVLIHDGARPNILISEIEEVYKETLKYDAAVLALPSTYAVKEVNDGFVKNSLDRKNIYLMQTPQGVNRLKMIEALDKIETLIYDDVEALEKVFHINAKIVNGRYENMKLTNQADLKYFEYLLGEENE